MKKGSSQKRRQQKPEPVMKWQTGAYDRRAEFSFLLPYPLLLLCRLMDITPLNLIKDFANALSCNSVDREGRTIAAEHLINYFIAKGYGQQHYTVEEIRQMFTEMDAVGMLFPFRGKSRLVDLYAVWRDKHQGYWFKKWFRKPRRRA